MRCSGSGEANTLWKSSVLWPSLPARRSIAGVARHVARHGDRVGADVLGRGFEFVLAPAGQVDAGAVIGEALGDRPSDTAGGTGDQGCLSVHGVHDTCPFDGARLHG
jgi:hypothetical protein